MTRFIHFIDRSISRLCNVYVERDAIKAIIGPFGNLADSRQCHIVTGDGSKVFLKGFSPEMANKAINEFDYERKFGMPLVDIEGLIIRIANAECEHASVDMKKYYYRSHEFPDGPVGVGHSKFEAALMFLDQKHTEEQDARHRRRLSQPYSRP